MAAVIQENVLSSKTSQRYNLYLPVHKALRGFMFNTVTRVGQADAEDECEFAQVVEQVRELLRACRDHLKHENEFVNPAMERAITQSSQQTREEHVYHAQAITALESSLNELITVPVAQRMSLIHSLYLQLTAFAAENLEHMLVEETDNHQVLIASYTDSELLQIKDSIVASISPEDNMLMMRWMLEYMNNAERILTLQGIKQHAPAPVLETVMELARNTLSQRDYFKLERAIS